MLITGTCRYCQQVMTAEIEVDEEVELDEEARSRAVEEVCNCVGAENMRWRKEERERVIGKINTLFEDTNPKVIPIFEAAVPMLQSKSILKIQIQITEDVAGQIKQTSKGIRVTRKEVDAREL